MKRTRAHTSRPNAGVANAAILHVARSKDAFRTGDGPDVLAWDPRASRLYVAAESGQVTVLQRHGRRLDVIHSGYLAENAHVVAVDPATGRSYYPVPAALSGHPALLVCEVA
jgi:hypothetical protein